MTARYACGDERRRRAVRHPATPPARLNGIDYLEVGANQRELSVVFIHPLPGAPQAVPPGSPPLTATNVVIEGGVRVPGVRVESVQASGHVLRVVVDRPGDFSTYTLRLRTSAAVPDPPGGFDPRLGSVSFSFKVDCPSDFDCGPSPDAPAAMPGGPEPDYLAKDYASFRRLMLDRLSALLPEWTERTPADLPVVLVEMLAYVGDELSYFQDAVATEAYLGTARQRVSVRRHARLLDYPMHEGSNARAWVAFEIEPGSEIDGHALPAGSPVLTATADERPMLTKDDLPGAWRERPVAFETTHTLTMRAAHNEIALYTWSDAECRLPRGSTRATLRSAAASPVRLARGDFLLFEEVRGAGSGLPVDADPTHRHVVRLTRVVATDGQGAPMTDPLTGVRVVDVEWGDEDGLPFALAVSGPAADGTDDAIALSVARGNVALADHGLTFVDDQALVPRAAPASDRYRPRLVRGPLTWSVPLELRIDPARFRSAAAVSRTDARSARPAISLALGDDEWAAEPDLLDSGRFQAHFVVEVGSDGVAHLRFGDGVHGRAPQPDASFVATYRIGNGRVGNVGAGALSRVVSELDGIVRVRNPLPAVGGTDPEPVAEVKLYAPHAFRRQERAVTAADYAEVAERHPDVQKAAATVRWTGSWHTVFVTIDRKGGRPVDAAFEDAMRRHLERYRLAGHDVEIAAPVFVPLDIVVKVCVEPGYVRGDVKAALLDVFSNRERAVGGRGFFHPDDITFGDRLYLSRVFQAALAVPGVASADVLVFQRWGRTSNQELEHGVLRTERLEIMRLDNDPNFPERGRIDFQLEGGV